MNSLRYIIIFAIIIAGAFIFSRIIRFTLDRFYSHPHKMFRVDSTHHTFLKHFLTALVYLIALCIGVYAVPSLRAVSYSLLAGAGVLAVILGFASQQAFSNIISGLFIAIFEPFRIGDKVKLQSGVHGIIEDINLRHTTIRDFENKRIIIPNAVISNEVIENAHIGDEKICKFIEFEISYDSNIDKAMKIMEREARKHPDFLDNRSKNDKKNKVPAIPVKVIGFTDSSIKLRAWAWTKDPVSAFTMACDLNKSIKLAFDKAGIEIPYPYRTIVYKKKRKNV
ncbi:mechanosensitive ion channel protein MscS [Candidatus Woesearchaeota archaeon CG10_big_fil_rev_8_21_14_0_10_34_8]|nr:MAG: mechanosensitive ion channel protein MscS [Candidatus Woesearchaeota archaeon CG10_big_fil_rev_8_21_14_0_10_34_8]